MNQACFTTKAKVYYEDTDAAGMVYHANYLKFAERARSDWLAMVGMPVETLIERFGGFFVVRSCQIDFVIPATLGDQLSVTVALLDAKGARMRLAQQVRRGETLLVAIELTLAFVDANGRARRIPPELIETVHN